MMRNLRFIGLLIKLKLSHMMVFRFSFFGAFFADAMLFVMQLVAFSAIYSQVDSIGGWNRGQMLIFIGTFSMLNGLNMVIYFFGVLTIPGKIRTGELDLYITKPVSPLLRLTFEHVNPGSFPLVILSIWIIAYGVRTAGITLTPAVVAGYIFLLILMTVLYYDVEVVLRTLPFFFTSTDAIEMLEGDMIMLNFKVPGVLYKGVLKALFWFAVPYGVMATVPTQLLTGILSPGGFIYAVLLTIGFTAFTLWFWRFGLKHYKSAGSAA